MYEEAVPIWRHWKIIARGCESEARIAQETLRYSKCQSHKITAKESCIQVVELPQEMSAGSIEVGRTEPSNFFELDTELKNMSFIC